MFKRFSFNSWTLFALILGGTLGFFPFSALDHVTSILSNLFVSALKLISLPMIFLAIVATITKLESLSEAKYFLKKILKYTISTTLLAASVALLLFLVIKPSSAGETVASGITPSKESYLTFLLKIVPSNPLQPFLENNVLGVAFMAAILSIAILYLPEEQKKTLNPFFQGLFQALLKISTAIVSLLPLGIFAFTYQFVHSARNEGPALEKLLYYALCVIGANFIQGFIILPLLLKRKGISPIKLAKSVFPALLSAFFSKSSNATLPLSLECAEKRFGINPKVSGFSLPLCSVINMNGCAAFILITVLFVSSSEGITYSFWQMLPWIALSTLAAIGNAGIPMGCFFLTSAFLLGMNIPLTLLGMILPLYALFDMVETALNVWSDLCVTAIVDKEIKEKQPTLLQST